MYKHYDFNISPQSTFVIGDTHGNWPLIKYNIKKYKISNAILIIAGDCGVGFEKLQYYIGIYNSMKKLLSENNVTIMCIRGNHDDPIYYNDNIIDEKHFKTISDYSVITVGHDEDKNNILCVGGAISIDRINRINFDIARSRYGSGKTKSYWDNEYPVYRPDILEEIFTDGININTVVTHSAPKFAPLISKDGIKEWILIDPELKYDIDTERDTITKIYNHIVLKNKNNINTWIYGHFHCHDIYTSNEGVKFIMLDMARINNNTWDVALII
jgi:hypothetical protein